ncbi:MAG: Uma2 family endonuclease [Acidobacteriia bacterium]|nr:Uma2 family endonuclease [Terriglobia bacterium]
MPVDTRLIYDDFCQLPDDGKRYEIIDGKLFVTPAPYLVHQRVVTRLTSYLAGFVENHKLGEVFVSPFDVVFCEFDVVEPDLLYISKARASVLTPKNVQGAPDLVVEVLSETTAKRDRSIKLKLYGQYGVQEYWVIDPDVPSADIYRRAVGGLELAAKLAAADALTSPLFPGFSLPLKKLVE